MPKVSRWHVLLIVFLFPLSMELYANTLPVPMDRVLQQALDRKLFEHPHWLNLGHYRPAYFPLHALLPGYESFVDDEGFFLAEDGKKSPQAELLATLKAFYEPGAKAKDGQPVLCRYQARYQWLNKQLDLGIQFLPEKECEKFSQWYETIKPGQVSLIFPSSYMNSSSSMFGHTLLRIDPPVGRERVDLISYAVNFGAIMDVSRFDPFYAYRGLAGGYPGRFAVMPYHKKVKEYSKIENRDIWEYSLNLSQEEVYRLILHLWEIGNSNFDYYFIDENCSFRLLSLLDVARPGLSSANEFFFTTIPIDTVRVLQEKGLVENTKYRPSKASIMQAYLAALNKTEQAMVQDLVKQPELLNEEPFQSLENERKPLLVNSAYQYLRYTQSNKGRSKQAADNSLALLSALNKLPDENKLVAVSEPARAEHGHKVKLAGLALGSIEEDAFVDFRFRVAYHDLLDNSYGFLRGTEIGFADTVFRWQEELGLELKKLDIIKIAALTPRTAFIKLPSWRLRTGVEQISALSEEHRVAFIEGGRGVSYSFHQQNISYALMVGRLEYNQVYNSNFAPGAGFEAGQLWYLPWGVAQLELFALEMLNADDYRAGLRLKHNIVATTNSAVRLSIERLIDREQQYTVGKVDFRYYF